MNIVEYPDREALCLALADRMASDIEAALLHEDQITIAVPGGTSPAPIFSLLGAASHIAWARVHTILTDERWVPESSDRSNARLLRQHLLTGPAAASVFHPYHVEGAEPGDAVGQISTQLAPLMPLAVVLLGMGEDMHTASLFPGAKGLEAGLAADAPVLVSVQAEGQEPRVSLSAAVLNGALSKHLVIYGDAKRAALDKAMTLPPEQAPIAAVLDNMTVHWAG